MEALSCIVSSVVLYVIWPTSEWIVGLTSAGHLCCKHNLRKGMHQYFGCTKIHSLLCIIDSGNCCTSCDI